MRPGAPPKPSRYVFTGPGEVFSLVTDPLGTPVTPCFKDIIWWATNEVFSSVQTFHTHTPCLWQGGVRAHEVKMRMRRGMMMRWKWRWDERLLNRDPRRGTQKKREGANTHQHTWPGAGKPSKGKGKEKRRPTDTEQDQRRGGRRKRLNQPDSENLRLPRHAQDPTFL